jgi:hypothetical protein
MVRIAVQVRSGAAWIRVAAQAESIERALELVKGQNADRECKVTFPIDPDTFFVGEDVATVGPVEDKQVT